MQEKIIFQDGLYTEEINLIGIAQYKSEHVQFSQIFPVFLGMPC